MYEIIFLCTSANVTVAYCYKYFRRTHFVCEVNAECKENQAVGKFVILDFFPGFALLANSGLMIFWQYIFLPLKCCDLWERFS